MRDGVVWNLVQLLTANSSAAVIADDLWPPILEQALHHGVAPLLYLRTREIPMPATAREHLKALYKSNLVRNHALAGEMNHLLALLREAGLPALELKGPALAQRLYCDFAARQIADLDILIRPGQFAAADELLHRTGFHRDARESRRTLQNLRDVLYRKSSEQGDIYLDLHFRLRPYGKRDALVEQVWHEGAHGSAETLLLQLCLNIITHRFARLQPWMDLIALLQAESSSLDWSAVVRRAQELEWPAGVYWCLRRANELSEAGLAPAFALQALAPGAASQVTFLRLTGGDAPTFLRRMPALDGPRGTLAAFLCESGARRRLRLAAAIVFPPAATLRQMDVPLRRSSVPVHYASRLLRKCVQMARPARDGQRSRAA